MAKNKIRLEDMLDSNALNDELRAMGATNVVPDLPVSPCVKSKLTGEIHVWNRTFAERPDLCVNCDETGNEDPATWVGRAPTRDMKLVQPARTIERETVYADPPEPIKPAAQGETFALFKSGIVVPPQIDEYRE